MVDPDLVEAVEHHSFEPVPGAEWRNHRLDFGSLPALIKSLTQLPDRDGLKLSAEALVESILMSLAQDEIVQSRARDMSNLSRLWDVFQTKKPRSLAAA